MPMIQEERGAGCGGGVRGLAAIAPFGCAREQMRVLAVAFLDELRRGDEAHRRGVHAVAHAGRTRAVVEQVAEVRVGVSRANLRARHAQRAIGLRRDVLGHERTREARPAGAGLELVGRAEERLAGDDVHVNARLVVVPICVLERPLGGFVLRDLVLQRRELFLQAVVGRFLERFHGVATRLGQTCVVWAERPPAVVMLAAAIAIMPAMRTI